VDFLRQLSIDFFHYLQEPGFIVGLLIFLAIFVAILALLVQGNYSLDPVRSRFKKSIHDEKVIDIGVSPYLTGLMKHKKTFVPADAQLVQRTAARLTNAGFYSRNSIMYYYALRTILIIVLPIVVLFGKVIIPGIETSMVYKSVLVAIILGYVAPSVILDKLVARRQKILTRAFPDALDLLVVCSEAGMSLDAAIQRVGIEMSFSQAELAVEFNTIVAEVGAGIERRIALQRMVERTGVEEIRGLVSALSQSMRFGTSIVETLKIYSEDLRDKRLQAAEFMAAKIATKMLFPLIFCLMPAFLMVIIGPAAMIFGKM
jgi:tight adherence protein C